VKDEHVVPILNITDVGHPDGHVFRISRAT
jgi:hypothetical protein